MLPVRSGLSKKSVVRRLHLEVLQNLRFQEKFQDNLSLKKNKLHVLKFLKFSCLIEEARGREQKLMRSS